MAVNKSGEFIGVEAMLFIMRDNDTVLIIVNEMLPYQFRLLLQEPN